MRLNSNSKEIKKSEGSLNLNRNGHEYAKSLRLCR